MTTQWIAGLFFVLFGLGTARAELVYVAPSGPVFSVFHAQAIRPATVVPAALPPPPPRQLPAVPVRLTGYVQPVPQLAVVGAPSDGQWVYTAQYGWVYMPYGDACVYSTVAAGESPYAYVYYPRYGWRWLAAPWVLGAGPHPYFGARGALAFGWYRALQRPGFAWGTPRAVHRPGGQVAVARATAAPAPRNPGAFHRGFQGGRLAHR